MADLCYLGGWKSPLTVMTVYQQPDQVTMRTALSNRDERRAGTVRQAQSTPNRQQTLFSDIKQKPRKRLHVYGAMI
jgi:hypothetical protein